MQIALHFGVHCTDEETLVRSLLQNKGRLAGQGIIIPGPSRYRNLIQTSIQKLEGQVASAETERLLLEEIVDDDTARRIVLCWDNFVCVPSRVFEGATLYGMASYKIAWIRNLFPSCAVELYFSLINPATLLPALLDQKTQWHKTLPKLLQGADLFNLRWADLIADIQHDNPGLPITVWSNEDTPFIWPQVMKAVSDHSDELTLKGNLNVASQIMEKEGFSKLREYLMEHAPQTEVQRQTIIADFLEEYALGDALESEVTIPDWSAEVIDEITHIYDEDTAEVSRMMGVTYLSV